MGTKATIPLLFKNKTFKHPLDTRSLLWIWTWITKMEMIWHSLMLLSKYEKHQYMTYQWLWTVWSHLRIRIVLRSFHATDFIHTLCIIATRAPNVKQRIRASAPWKEAHQMWNKGYERAHLKKKRFYPQREWNYEIHLINLLPRTEN